MAADWTTPLNYFAVLTQVQQLIPADSIVVSEGANTMDIGRTILLNRLPRHRLDAGTLGPMGVGPAFAIAAALYCRDHQQGKRVVCVEVSLLLPRFSRKKPRGLSHSGSSVSLSSVTDSAYVCSSRLVVPSWIGARDQFH